MVGARFQSDVGYGANGGVSVLLGIPQGHDFGVRAAGLLGVTLADDVAI